jgi:ribose transport system substrate-binding protein
MSSTHRRLAPLTTGVAFATLAVMLAGCSSGSPSSPSGEPASSDVSLAVVLPNTSDPFFATISCGAEAKAEELGVEVGVFNSTNTDANTMSSNFQSALLTDPDGILVTPFNNNQFIAQYQTLMADGVPIVTGAGTEPQAEYLNVYSDTDTAPLAEELLPMIPEGAGSMVFLGGAPGIPPLEARTAPFVAAVQELRPDLTALPTDYSGFDTNKASTSVSSLILANPDLKLIIAADGPDGLGAAAAVEQAGKKGEIAVIAFDAVPGEVDALKAGTITALIAQNPTEIGARSIEALVEYLEEHPDGGAVSPSGSEAIANKVLTADDVDDPANAGYLYNATC